MNILDKIVIAKREEVQQTKELYPVKLLEKSIYFPTNPLSLSGYLLRPELSGIIAEFKRRSPSKGIINAYAKPEDVGLGYMKAGASALSVLTDKAFFGGSNEDLIAARKVNYCPILRKDFIIDEYQILEAKSIGADAILLIAAILTKAEIKQFADLAHSLGLEVLLELHGEEELEKLYDGIKLVGINNRDLRDFSVDIKSSLNIGRLLPDTVVKVSESGISQAENIQVLREAGFQGFLIGEAFMRQDNPAKACRNFISQVKALQNEKKHLQS